MKSLKVMIVYIDEPAYFVELQGTIAYLKIKES